MGIDIHESDILLAFIVDVVFSEFPGYMFWRLYMFSKKFCRYC